MPMHAIRSILILGMSFLLVTAVEPLRRAYALPAC